jgi:signal transduction histidine kinase
VTGGDDPFSLRSRLTRIVIVVFVGSWLVAAVATTQSARSAFLQETDRTLESMLVLADTVGSSVVSELSSLASRAMYAGEEIGPDPHAAGAGAGEDARRLMQLRDVPGADADYSPRLNVWTKGEHYLVGSGTPAFATPGPATATGVAVDQPVAGEQWRVMYRHDARTNIWYAAGVAASQVRFGGTELLLRLLLPLALVLPLTVLALYLGIARGLHPLARLVDAIETRRRSSSLAPVPTRHTPQELQPVVASLNQLLVRLAATLEDEKSFTANAAHELKTPLAAISAEVHLCQRLTREVETRDRMARVLQRVERASHSVSQLLVLARFDPQAALPKQSLDLCALVQDVIAESGDLASARQLHVHVDVPPQTAVRGDWDAVAILLRNLVVNAFHYTPEGGDVVIAMDGSILSFSNDSGPIANPARLTDRFYRNQHDTGGEIIAGTGLGLAIALRICELHGFGFSVDYRAQQQRFYAVVDFRACAAHTDVQTAGAGDDAHTAG